MVILFQIRFLKKSWLNFTLSIFSENFWKDKEKEELQDYYDYDYS